MRLIERLLGNKDTTVAESPARSGSGRLPRKSVFSGPPSRILRTESDVKKDDALLEMSQVVAEIEKDPNTNWQRYKKDFEKAVTGMREAFEERSPEHGIMIGDTAATDTQARKPDKAPVAEKSVTPDVQTIWEGRWVASGNWAEEIKGLAGKSASGIHSGMISRDYGTGEERTSWGPAVLPANAEQEKYLTIVKRHYAGASVDYAATSDDAYETRSEKRDILSGISKTQEAVIEGAPLSRNISGGASGLVKELRGAGYKPDLPVLGKPREKKSQARTLERVID